MDDELLTERDAAKVLGVAPYSLKAARLGITDSSALRIPHVRLGRLVRYRRADISEHIRANRVEP